MPNQVITKTESVDQEWIALIQMARETGITIEEIRQFLNQR